MIKIRKVFAREGRPGGVLAVAFFSWSAASGMRLEKLESEAKLTGSEIAELADTAWKKIENAKPAEPANGINQVHGHGMEFPW